jgi:hypothetical protein
LIPTTLVTGASARDREAAIAARLPELPFSSSPSSASSPAAPFVAVILEGLADPGAALAADQSAGTVPVQIERIAPGCLCCAGNLVLRVTLNRLLRRRPARLFIALADATHVGQLRAMLSAPPYAALLSLGEDVIAP